MNEQQILEGNKLIAEFMGDAYSLAVSKTNENSRYYHSSWDWLMPVVEKIETIQLPSPSMVPISVKIKNKSCHVFKGEWHDGPDGFIKRSSPNSKIEATYHTVIAFIKWYNEQS